MRRRLRPRPRGACLHPRVAVLTAALLVLALSPACSDAHTQDEKDWADTGQDPRLITIVAPEGLDNLAESLGQAFLPTHPDIRILYAFDDPGKIEGRVRSAATPVVWIDDTAALDRYSRKPKRSKTLGEDVLARITSAKFPGEFPRLIAFGGDGPSTGLCASDLACGRAAREMLADAGVNPNPDREYPTERALIDAVVANRVNTAIVYNSGAVDRWRTLRRRPLLAPNDGRRTIEARTYSSDPKAEEFMDWLDRASVVDSLVSQAGIRRNSRS